MTIKINQMLSLRIEQLLANGFTRAEIVDHLKNGTLSQEHALLIEFAEMHWDECEAAILHGYQVTFHTINGVKSLLAAKFGLQAERDYRAGEDHLADIQLSDSDVEWLRSVLAVNWRVIEQSRDQAAKRKTVQISWNPPQ